MIKRKHSLLLSALLSVAISLLASVASAQENQVDSIQFTALSNTSRLYFMDDMYIVAGGTVSGPYFSNNFRDLSFTHGYMFGVEQYYPLSGKFFLNTGVNISSKNFKHNPIDNETINIHNLYADIPVSASYELPTQTVDFRFILGIFGSYRLQSSIEGDYTSILQTNPDIFQYREDNFYRFDTGWLVGTSVEYKNILVRFRAFSGFMKFDRQDQGMMSSFNLDLGYFLFRKSTKR